MIAVFWLGGLVMQAVFCLFIIIGMYELYGAFGKRWLPVHFVGYGFALAYMVFIDFIWKYGWFLIFSIGFILAVMVALVLFHKKVHVRDCVAVIFGFFYVCVLLSTAYLVRETDEVGILIVWVIFVSAWGADTGAYFTGVFFGKHKLTSLSPKKTVEGAVGGVLTAALLCAGYGYILTFFIDVDLSVVIPLMLIGAVGAVLSIFGDLAASAVKRGTDIKDFGNLFPGHGGILDRFDSVLFTAPAVYLFLIWSVEFGVWN
jgi:phosphatidate cytidylyltransferase